jgi:uncharacterized protein YodC (DUF2158 family)
MNFSEWFVQQNVGPAFESVMADSALSPVGFDRRGFSLEGWMASGSKAKELFPPRLIDAGLIVRLVSGGPKMTVRGMSAGWVKCDWFAGDDLRSDSFLPDQLEYVDPLKEAILKAKAHIEAEALIEAESRDRPTE